MAKLDETLGAAAVLLALTSSCAHQSPNPRPRDVLGDNCYEDARCNRVCVAADDEPSQRYCEQLQLEVRNHLRAK